MFASLHQRGPSVRRRGFILVLAGIVAMLGPGAVDRVGAQPPSAVVGFEPVSQTFDCGEIYAVDIVIDAVADLRGFSLVVGFDSDVIQPLSVTAGALVSGAACDHFLAWLNPGAVADSIAVDGATLGCSVAGPGAIVHLEFEGYLQGTSDLAIGTARLRTAANDTIAVSVQAATIDYICPVAVTHVGWGALKSRYR